MSNIIDTRAQAFHRGKFVVIKFPPSEDAGSYFQLCKSHDFCTIKKKQLFPQWKQLP